MDHLTVIEWLRENRLTEQEIDFIMTFIPALSVLEVDREKLPQVSQMLTQHFPTFVIDHLNNLQFSDVDTVIQTNIPYKISTKELLKRMSAQGLCRLLSESLLAAAK